MKLPGLFMIISLTIVRYRGLLIPFALIAMAIHRLPLWLNKQCSFWKLLGCGKNGTFDLSPDWQQWGLLAVWDTREDFNHFYTHSLIRWWWKTFTHEQWTILCEPLISHGKWNGKHPFGKPEGDKDYTGTVAVLTRATIRLNKLKQFWSNVPHVATIMAKAPGYITSVGIGEAPFFLQATFSVWKNADSIKAFAYESKEHSEVIRKTREGHWYSEELFARFKPIASIGTLHGKDPLEGVL
jgi:hypothetical protein